MHAWFVENKMYITKAHHVFKYFYNKVLFIDEIVLLVPCKEEKENYYCRFKM